MTPAELRAEAALAQVAMQDAEKAFDFAENRYMTIKAAVESLATTGLCVWRGEAVAEDTIQKPAPRGEYVDFENDVRPDLVEKARKVGLRDFFLAPNDGGKE